ncbi:MAG TPA: ATP-binding cassette domain-containing protein [Flavobacteriales bacterium]|nr:ATP-binding cassette domain-containing protein [Flavobacteriales bacterium]HRE95781.1 ATP-binding cassette domain-containing protein [Flavobacteriales bacterium]HRJ34701.1 ATP-binding cassette domain-containing protein [Flavobacteriales bacterium]HRJ38709.1 ATP-binding cassette domain-containing protein [Flavobacteriales bacterium]
MMDILRAENIVKRYRNHTALSGVNIAVPEGSIFGLLGPNGAGKTSLIRIINQITGPDEGTVYFRDEKLSPHHLSNIGYLPEERGLYKKMKVGEQSLYLARLKGMSKQEATRQLQIWFEKFEISGWWNKKIEDLSKGMAQKVQFITTVMHQPKLLILDEPFSGFDPINADLIKKEILRMKENGTTIIFSTHNMGSVEEMCDEIALINNSKVILDGKMSDIRKRFRSQVYEVEFNGNMIAFANALWAGFELLEREQVEPNHFRSRVKLLGNNTTNNLLSALIPHVEIRSVREIIPSMNDIFIEVVQSQNQNHG